MIKDKNDENLDFYIAQLNEYIKDDETEDNDLVDSVLDFYFDNSDDDDDNCTIFVGNLPENETINGIPISYDNQYLDESYIRKFFENYSISNEPGSIKIKRKTTSFGFYYSYAFVKFESKEQAQQAIKQFNNTKIFEKEICLISYDKETKNILRSNQNCLLIKMLLQGKSPFFDYLPEIGEFIYCQTYQHFQKKDDSIYIYIQFRNQAGFEKATQELKGIEINDIPIEIKQFFPFKNQKDQNQTQRICLIKNLPENFLGDELFHLFNEFGNPIKCRVIIDEKGKNRNFGFCLMQTHEEAVKAIEGLNCKKIGEFELSCSIALSINDIKKKIIELKMMEMMNYTSKMKNIYDSVIDFIEEEEKYESEKKYNQLIKLLKKHDFEYYGFKSFLYMVLNISDNHQRNPYFFDKIFQILIFLKDTITNLFTNKEIFNFFKSNKRILLFFIQEKFMTIDKDIVQNLENDKLQYRQFSSYFYPEFKKITDQVENLSEDDLTNFEEKRKIGENTDYICQLIRNDDIDKFIPYIEQNGKSLDSKINQSVFETNSYLIENTPNLIEYSAFYGSIKIFNHLYKKSNILLTPSLWLYAIHGRNPEIIVDYLEYKNVDFPKGNNCVYCLKESIKCHHRDISDYFLMIDKDKDKNKDKIIRYGYHYYNYNFYSNDFSNYNICKYAAKYDHFNIKNIETFEFLLEQQKTSIEKSFFEKGKDISAIKIPSYIISIDDNAFENLLSLKQIEIPSSVTSIGKRAFSKCSKLTQIEIPSSITIINDFLFNECISLTQIIIPSSVTEIGISAFEGCSSLKQITFEDPSSVTNIERYAFSGCSSLTTIIIPSSVTYIGYDVFRGCSSLTQITIPSSLSVIQEFTFYQCTSLSEVLFEIPSSLKRIGKAAFAYCSSLKQITIPSSVSLIMDRCFFKCTALKNLIFENHCSLTKIDEFLLGGCSSLTEIFIPSSVTDLVQKAFCSCTSLKKVIFDINSPIEVIDDFSFNGCSSLTDIILPPSVVLLGNNAFSYCTSLKQVNIPPSLNYFGAHVFEFCSSLEKVEIPSSVSVIGSYTFYGCSSLKQIKLPPKLKDISSFLFGKCTALTDIELPSSLKEIPIGAFEQCSSLKKILIPSSVEVLRELSFSQCVSLSKISIPSSIFFIGFGAFNMSKLNLDKIIPKSLTNFGNDIFCLNENLTKNVKMVFISKIPVSFTNKEIEESFSLANKKEGCFYSKFDNIGENISKVGTIKFKRPLPFQEIVASLVNQDININDIYPSLD